MTTTSFERIQVRAYFYWINCGCPSGTEVSDWQCAEDDEEEWNLNQGSNARVGGH